VGFCMELQLSYSQRARLGALRRYELYGNPGTPEGRRKGGRVTIQLFQRRPSFAQKKGFITAKDIAYPSHSTELAEFIGIMLGDGGLRSPYQCAVTYNGKTDQAHARFIISLVKELFNISCSIQKKKKNNGVDILICSSNLVSFLLKEGLILGNKVVNQIKVPEWICSNALYRSACLRGLMDTDGSVYRHEYRSNGKIYSYCKINFTNRSRPLLTFVFDSFRMFDYKTYKKEPNVYIYSAPDVHRYMTEIGTHNPKHRSRFESFS
jgi:DNA-binding transcriptional regulator WhiA